MYAVEVSSRFMTDDLNDDAIGYLVSHECNKDEGARLYNQSRGLVNSNDKDQVWSGFL